MKISTENTETVVIGRQEEAISIKLNDTEIKQTNRFKYLGSFFSSGGKIDREINILCTKANQVLGHVTPLLGHKKIPLSTKTNLIGNIVGQHATNVKHEPLPFRCLHR